MMQNKWKDHYSKEARKLGYRARSAFKLLEIQQKYKILRKGCRVLELGSAPGGWTQVICDLVLPGGDVLCVDIQNMKPIPGAEFVCADFKDLVFDDSEVQKDDENTPDNDKPSMPSKKLLHSKFDLVLSDMAPNTTGDAFVDQHSSLNMLKESWDLCSKALKKGGGFLSKCFQSQEMHEFIKILKKSFSTAKIIKPKSSKSKSFELYIYCGGFNEAVYQEEF